MKKALEEIAEKENIDIEIEMKAFQLDPSAGEHATGDTYDLTPLTGPVTEGEAVQTNAEGRVKIGRAHV